MRSINPLGYAVSGSAILALLAGCSGGGGSSSPMPAAPASLMHQPASRSLESSTRRNADPASVLRPDVVRVSKPDLSPGFADIDAAAKGAIIVSDAGTNDVYVYSAAKKLVATITGFDEPQGLAGTKAGSFYVANTAASTIPLYKNDYKTVIATLQDPGEYPAGVGYDETTGTVGVTNIISTSDTAGSVSFYAKGKTKPCKTVSNSSFEEVYFGAFDAKGDFFVSGFSTSGTVLIGEVVGGCNAKTITPLKISNSIEFPGGVQVTKAGDIAIDDQEGFAIYTYKPPVKGSLGKPVSTTPLTGSGDPVSYSFTSTEKDLWTADAADADANEFAYPKGGSPVTSITGLTEPIGVVVTPVEIP
jgi:hypothetical protein